MTEEIIYVKWGDDVDKVGIYVKDLMPHIEECVRRILKEST